MKSRAVNALPLPVKKALRQFGEDIRAARVRRRIPMAIMAERAFISRATLSKVEKGDPSVAFGTYVTVLFVLGLGNKLSELVSLSQDSVGQSLEERDLPTRVRLSKPSKKPS